MRAISTSLATIAATICLIACGPQPTGSGGSGGVGGSGSGGTGAVGTGGVPGAPCFKPGRTIMIGDSYINWGSHNLPSDLANVSGQTWTDYAVPGSSLATGGTTVFTIPTQLEQAISALGQGNIDTLVWDGGGNDVLMCDTGLYPTCADCRNLQTSPTIQMCQDIVAKALDAATKIGQRAAAVGIKRMVFFFYPTVPNGTPIGGAYPNAIEDYARPKAKALCDSAVALGVPCTFVDMVPVFAGHPEYFAVADIHPNPLGSAAMAKAIWSAMQRDCVSQPAGSCGCVQ